MQEGMKHMRCEWINGQEYSVLKGKRILVAGGTGFIGKRAVEILSKLGLEIYVLTRKDKQSERTIKYLKADLNDINSLKQLVLEGKFDFSVYLAANIPLRGEKKEDYFDAKKSTFDPFLNFCEVFLPLTKRFIYASSVDVLGGCESIGYDEDAPIHNATPYGLAKHVGELYTKDICKSLGISYSILRFAQVYGPNEPVVRIIPILKSAIIEGREFTLVTSGNERRRFLFIDDAVKAITNAMLFSQDEIYNIAGPDMISMKELIALMEKVWGKDLNLVIKNEVKGLDNVPSIEKATSKIQYKPDISMEMGMRIILEEEKC